MDKQASPMIVVGIAGPSASGKSLLAHNIKKELGDGVAKISEDSYYRDRPDLSLEERHNINFDHPSAFDHDLMVQHVTQLMQGRTIDVPIWDYHLHRRAKESTLMSACPVIILEGILLFTSPALRALIDTKIFMDTPLDTCLLRRILRDTQERGRDIKSVITQYTETVRPMYVQFIEPSKRYADIIVPQGGENRVAINMIKATLSDLVEMI